MSAVAATAEGSPRLSGLMFMLLLLVTACSEPPDTFFSDSLSSDTVSQLIDALEEGETDAFEVMREGELLASWGAVDRRTNAASIRKSLISGLYGIAVEKGLIDPQATLAQLGIDEENNPLTPTEQEATVMDLLQARSGVYLPAMGESPGMIERKPKRGSAGPGEQFYYNNWDFNVLGTIFEMQTGLSIGEAFYQWIAEPVGMQDFRPADVHYQEGELSDHRMYRFYLSARDLTRFGVLYVNKGHWNDSPIIPADWVSATLTSYSEVPYSDRADGYGLLWWIDTDGRRYLAEGSGGQFLIVSPERQLVMVTRNDTGFSLMGRVFHNPLAEVAPFDEINRLWQIIVASFDE